MKDLFGEEIKQSIILRDKFTEIPFSVLDAKGGKWQQRKKNWLNIGIKSEIGRSAICLAQGLNKYDPRDSYTGKSVFDSTLTELMYKWFCSEGGEILDPFAGGSVRGIVANYLGYNYTGIELRQEQVDSNREQALDILPVNKQPQWYVGDSNIILNDFNKQFDFIFSCPPYFNLEVYSDLKEDLSNMTYENFLINYKSIIKKSIKLLRPNSFACFVVGEVRDDKGFYLDFVSDTKRAFIDAGAKLYNDMILLENGLNTAAMRADKQFTSSKKVVKVHQNILVFKKF
jgi:DNA modification methylase